METIEETKKLYFLLMGKIGHGKSSTGNTILGRSVFPSSSKAASMTKVVNDDYAQFEDYILKVVDGPGLEDTQISKDKATEITTKNMEIALAKCSEGVDAFLFVLKFGGKFSNDDQSALESLKRLFGENYYNHVIVIYTCGDLFQGSLENDVCDFDDFEGWCKQQESDVKDLYENCNRRFVLFNNREKDEEKRQEQVRQVIELAENLQIAHGRYTSACFKRAAEEREKLILTMKAPQLREDIQEKIAILVAQIHDLNEKRTGTSRREIEKTIQELNKKIEDLDSGHDELKKLKQTLEKVKKNFDNEPVLKRLAGELNNIRKSIPMWEQIGIFCTITGCVLILAAILLPEIAIAGAVCALVGVAVNVGGTVAGAVQILKN